MAVTIPIDWESSQTRFHIIILLCNVSRFTYCIVICSWGFSKPMRNENSANVHPSNRRKARSYPHTNSQLQQEKRYPWGIQQLVSTHSNCNSMGGGGGGGGFLGSQKSKGHVRAKFQFSGEGGNSWVVKTQSAKLWPTFHFREGYGVFLTTQELAKWAKNLPHSGSRCIADSLSHT